MKKLLLCIIVSLLLCAGCTSRLDAEAISDHASDGIVISGLTENDFTVTVGELAALDMVERSASASRSNGQEVHIDANGPLLDTFLRTYGKKQTDFTSIRFSATDNYSIAVSHDVLAGREIVLALGDGGKPLSGDDAPVRVVIPGERAMYWVRHLCRIDFETDTAASMRSQKIVFLETAAGLLHSSDYEYYGETDRVVSVKDLFNAYVGKTDEKTKVNLIASDGLQKTETSDNFLHGQIKYTGADSPRFVSAELPEGMQVYDLVWIGYGDCSFVSLPQLLAQSGKANKVLFSDLIRGADFANTETYDFTFTDGSSVTLTLPELTEAYLTIDTQGHAVLWTENGGKQMKDLLSVEAGNE